MAFVLVVKMRTLEGKDDEAAEVMRELAGATRQEPGCIHYIPVRSVDDPRAFLFYEEYADRAALDAHAASEHFERLATGNLFTLLESRERSFFETVE
jgi:quinol monooxygenase YgiN